MEKDSRALKAARHGPERFAIFSAKQMAIK